MATGKRIVLGAVALIALASFAGGVYFFVTHTNNFQKAGRVATDATAADTIAGRTPNRAPSDLLAVESIELSEQDLAAVKPEPVTDHEFPIEKTAVGTIDFNQDMTVQVFTPYPGRIASLSASSVTRSPKARFCSRSTAQT